MTNGVIWRLFNLIFMELKDYNYYTHTGNKLLVFYIDIETSGTGSRSELCKAKSEYCMYKK